LGVDEVGTDSNAEEALGAREREGADQVDAEQQIAPFDPVVARFPVADLGLDIAFDAAIAGAGVLIVAVDTDPERRGVVVLGLSRLDEADADARA